MTRNAGSRIIPEATFDVRNIVGERDSCGVLKAVSGSDVAIVAVALIPSVLLFDLFPGPMAILTLIVGGAAWLQLHRRNQVARTHVDVLVGMLLALAVIIMIALIHR